MRQLKLLGIALVAILSLSIAATSAAQAVELKFLPEKATFTFRSLSNPILRTLGGKIIECESVSGAGEALTERLGDVDFTFLGCKNPTLGVKCTGLNDSVTGAILLHAEYHVRHLLNETGHPEDVIMVILILGDGTSGSTTAHFSCLGILFTVLGCVASDDLKRNSTTLWLAGELVSSFLVNFLPKTAGSGDALITSIDTDNSLGMENCILGTKQEAAAEDETSSQQGEGIVENCKKAGVACTFLIDLSGTP